MRKIVLFVLSILLCLSFYSDFKYFSTHNETTGIIREIHYTDKHTEPTPTNVKSRVTYMVDDVQYNGFITNWNVSFQKGKEIPIFYNIENPEEFNYIYQFNHLSFTSLFFLIVLFALVFIKPTKNKTINRLLKGTYLYRERE